MFTIRPYDAVTDKAFVYSTMLKGLYYSNSFYNEIAKDVFFANYAVVLERLLTKNVTSVLCLTDEPDVIIGYSIYNESLLHYIYLKPAWRNKKSLTKLLLNDTLITTCTHLTEMVLDKRLEYNIAFNPWRI